MEPEAILGEFLQKKIDKDDWETKDFKIGDLAGSKEWPAIFQKPGVYVFYAGDTVVYVGRALGSLWGRVYDQIKSTSNPKWAAVVENGDNKVKVFAYSPKENKTADLFWVTALEYYLIQSIGPEFNKRCQ